MIIFHNFLQKDICDKIIKKFDELNNKNIVRKKKKDDIRIFGFEKVLDKNISNFFFDVDSKSSLKFFKIKPKFQTLMVNKTFLTKDNTFLENENKTLELIRNILFGLEKLMELDRHLMTI